MQSVAVSWVGATSTATFTATIGESRRRRKLLPAPVEKPSRRSRTRCLHLHPCASSLQAVLPLLFMYPPCFGLFSLFVSHCAAVRYTDRRIRFLEVLRLGCRPSCTCLAYHFPPVPRRSRLCTIMIPTELALLLRLSKLARWLKRQRNGIQCPLA